ncbi:MAG: hypothetical protein U9R17_01000 [Thermodesulfobacteriota bacterium]|nr:hypothetical protein [Thermodesulfobacteriota bacterium]
MGDQSAPACAIQADRCRNAQAGMKRVYGLDVYKLAEKLSVRAWYDFDKR